MPGEGGGPAKIDPVAGGKAAPGGANAPAGAGKADPGGPMNGESHPDAPFDKLAEAAGGRGLKRPPRDTAPRGPK